jgi:hypothetical protein
VSLCVCLGVSAFVCVSIISVSVRVCKCEAYKSVPFVTCYCIGSAYKGEKVNFYDSLSISYSIDHIAHRTSHIT